MKFPKDLGLKSLPFMGNVSVLRSFDASNWKMESYNGKPQTKETFICLAHNNYIKVETLYEAYYLYLKLWSVFKLTLI